MTTETTDISPDVVIAGVDAKLDFQFAVIDAMKACGMTERQLAEKSGLSLRAVRKAFSSDGDIHMEQAGRILRSVNLTIRFEKADGA